MQLRAQAPTGVGEAVGGGGVDMDLGLGRVVGDGLGLEEKIPEISIQKGFRVEVGLGIYQLQFIATAQDSIRARLGADAEPVHRSGKGVGAVGFHRHRQVALAQGLDQRFVEL